MYNRPHCFPAMSDSVNLTEVGVGAARTPHDQFDTLVSLLTPSMRKLGQVCRCPPSGLSVGASVASFHTPVRVAGSRLPEYDLRHVIFPTVHP